MTKLDLAYGKTPIFRLYDDGTIEEYVCSGYTECETYDVVNEEYVITSFVHGRNERCSNAVFSLKAISEGYYSPLIGKDAFFSKEDVATELARRQKETKNLEKAHNAEKEELLKSIHRRARRK